MRRSMQPKLNDEVNEMGDEEDDDVSRIPCCFCGAPTTWDPVYNDLCAKCCRASNE